MTSTENEALLNVDLMAHQHGDVLSEILSARARLHPARTILRFVDYSSERIGVTQTVTFAELDTRVNATAAAISRCVGSGERIAVLAPQGVDFIVGFLGALRAGLIAVPLFSPDLPGHGERLSAVLADCRPALALATSANAAVVTEFVGGMPVLILDDVDSAAADGYTRPVVGPGDLAYLQYTSGSTRLPAGVRITHGNVVDNAAQALVAGRGTEDSTLVSWLPLFHDMGLVFVVGGSIVGGMPAVLIDPIAFLMKPVRWLQHLAESPKTFTAAPNFAFDFCAKKIKVADRAGLDLSGVITMFNGAEPIQPESLTRFYDVFGPHGLRRGVIAPSYGLAEATVYVSCNTADDRPQAQAFDLEALSQGWAVAPDPAAAQVELVACGVDVEPTVAIADPATGTRCPDGRVGEIWINSRSVGDGYWNDPTHSDEVFGQILLDAGDLPGSSWMRSGDLGTVVEGRLFVTGRIKDLLIIDGRNHYPQDLELTVENAHPAVGHHRSAAFSIDSSEGERAVVVAEISRHEIAGDWAADEVTRAVTSAVSRQHGLALTTVVLLEPDSIPRTTSGKIARAASRTAFLADTLSVARPRA